MNEESFCSRQCHKIASTKIVFDIYNQALNDEITGIKNLMKPIKGSSVIINANDKFMTQEFKLYVNYIREL